MPIFYRLSTLLHNRRKVILICCIIICACHFSNVFQIEKLSKNKKKLKTWKNVRWIKNFKETIFLHLRPWRELNSSQFSSVQFVDVNGTTELKTCDFWMQLSHAVVSRFNFKKIYLIFQCRAGNNASAVSENISRILKDVWTAHLACDIVANKWI